MLQHFCIEIGQTRLRRQVQFLWWWRCFILGSLRASFSASSHPWQTHGQALSSSIIWINLTLIYAILLEDKVWIEVNTTKITNLQHNSEYVKSISFNMVKSTLVKLSIWNGKVKLEVTFICAIFLFFDPPWIQWVLSYLAGWISNADLYNFAPWTNNDKVESLATPLQSSNYFIFPGLDFSQKNINLINWTIVQLYLLNSELSETSQSLDVYS